MGILIGSVSAAKAGAEKPLQLLQGMTGRRNAPRRRPCGEHTLKRVALWLSRIAGGVVCAVVVSFSAVCLGATLPAEIQAPLLGKLFKYTPTLGKQGKLRVLVVATGSSMQLARKVAAAFAVGKVEAKVVDITELASNLDGVQVLYVCPGAGAVADTAVKHRLLTTTGVEEYVRNGSASVAVIAKENRPFVLVNLPRVKEEGHQVSAHVLNIAEVIR